MTTKLTASFFPSADMPASKDWQQINTSLEWAARYQDSIGLNDTAQQTRALISVHEDLMLKGVLK